MESANVDNKSSDCAANSCQSIMSWQPASRPTDTLLSVQKSTIFSMSFECDVECNRTDFVSRMKIRTDSRMKTCNVLGTCESGWSGENDAAAVPSSTRGGVATGNCTSGDTTVRVGDGAVEPGGVSSSAALNANS